MMTYGNLHKFYESFLHAVFKMSDCRRAGYRDGIHDISLTKDQSLLLHAVVRIRIRIRIHMFLGFPDPSIIMQK